MLSEPALASRRLGLRPGLNPRWSCRMTGAIGVGPRSAREEVLVVAEATAKPQMSSAFQVRRQIVNFGGRRNHLGTLVKNRDLQPRSLKLGWAGTQFVEFNKFPHVIPMLWRAHPG